MYTSPLRDARGRPLDGDNAHPFPDFYTYFRHYRAFYVAINSFSVALKFLKGILNTWRGAAAILMSLAVNKTVYSRITRPSLLSNSPRSKKAEIVRHSAKRERERETSEKRSIYVRESIGSINRCTLPRYLRTVPLALILQIVPLDG